MGDPTPRTMAVAALVAVDVHVQDNAVRLLGLGG